MATVLRGAHFLGAIGRVIRPSLHGPVFRIAAQASVRLAPAVQKYDVVDLATGRGLDGQLASENLNRYFAIGPHHWHSICQLGEKSAGILAESNRVGVADGITVVTIAHQ